MRRRHQINPHSIGDQVVIQAGSLAGLIGTVVGRDHSGRLTVAFNDDEPGVLIQIHHRNVAPVAVGQQRDDER